MGGDEIIHKAYKYGWLAESVTEDEIIESQKLLAESGYFVEPASATPLYAIKKLRESGKIEKTATVVTILTGSGLKDMTVLRYHKFNVTLVNVNDVEKALSNVK